MCGICGVVYHESGKVDPRALRAAVESVRHRGPDEEGVYVDSYAGLAARRLSIIDLPTGGQPMANADGSLRLVFNGEIYNFLELRSELETSGYRFRTKSDTEVILALYEKFGTDCVRKLRGMFAFALWDLPRKRLLLARDRIGVKPLLYSEGPGFIAFGSELRCLFQWPVSGEILPHAVDLYLSLQYVPSPWTIYKSIQKLPPAHILIYEDGRAKLERYWDLPADQPSVTDSVPEAMEMLRDKFAEAVRLRLIADVPLGAFLSGGIDSSLVVAVMSELSAHPIKTFSIGFELEEYSELPYARELARYYGCDHREFIVKAEMADVLPKLAWHYGEPFADASALPSYYVARETHKFVKVALNGDGGDEDFAGYDRYYAMKVLRLWDRLPRSLQSVIAASMRLLPDDDGSTSLSWRLKRFLSPAIAPDLTQRHINMSCYFTEAEKAELFTPELANELVKGQAENARGLRDYFDNAFARAKTDDLVNRLLYVDTITYLPECLMTKMDIATMANSLEARSPFLDHEFMELAARMPGDWKLKGLKGHKWILKEAFKDKLPPAIYRRGKMGFASPVDAWFRGRLKDYWQEIVLSPRALSRGYFQEKTLRNLWESHQSGKQDRGRRLWTLLMFELWHRECLEKQPLRGQ